MMPHSHPECLRIVPIIVATQKLKAQPNQPGQRRSNAKVHDPGKTGQAGWYPACPPQGDASVEGEELITAVVGGVVGERGGAVAEMQQRNEFGIEQ